MSNHQAAYAYPQQQHMQMQQMQQRQMQQRQMQMQMHVQQQQRMHQHQQQMQQQQQQQQQQQTLRERKKQEREKQQQKSGEDDEDDDSYDDDGDDGSGEDEGEDSDQGEDDESLSSLSEVSTESDTESASDDSSTTAGKRSITFDVKHKSKSHSKCENKDSPTTKATSKSTSRAEKAKAKAKATGAEAREDKPDEAASNVGAANITGEMEKLAMTKLPPAHIPSSALSPGEYMYNVISDVLSTNNKKNFQRILARTPLPIALKYLHQIAQKAFASGNRDIHKVVIDTNKKYNVVSDLYLDAFATGDSKSTTNAMNYLGKTIEAFRTGAEFNTDELLKFFTPEFIAMNLIQSGNIATYDKVMTEFKNEEIRISRGFHVAKPLLAAYFGVPSFFSNQKRYSFNRDIIVLAICGGSTETLDYVIKKTKIGKISHDIVLEARSCQPIPAHMMKHLVEKYSVSDMSI